MQRVPIKDALPLAVAAAVEAVGVLELQKRLGLAVAGLLPEVRPRRLAAMVPDERSRSEGDPPARLLETPADVHVVAGLAKLADRTR